MLLSKKVLLSGLAAAALAAPAFAEDRSTEKQKEQYIYQQSQEQGLGKATGEGAIGATKPNSGPGVQGPADTRTGPATHAPGGGSAEVKPDASSGASSGEAGMGDDNATQPSQDSSGVQGFPDTRTGPATKGSEGSTP
jgi:type II secretory pathway pseudopilin PulG